MPLQTESVGTILAKTQNAKAAAQAANPNTRRGQGDIKAAGVVGNVHIPNTNPDEPLAPGAPGAKTEGPTPPTQPAETLPKVTDQSRYVDEQTYEMPPQLERTLDAVDEDKALDQLSQAKPAVKEYLKKNITDLYTAASNPDRQTAFMGEVTEEMKAAGYTNEQQTAATGFMQQIWADTLKLSELPKDSTERAAMEARQVENIGKLSDMLGGRGPDGKVVAEWDKIESVLGDPDKIAQDIIATGLADNVVVDDTLLGYMGYDTDDEKKRLFELLGLELADRPTVTELQKKVDEYITQKYTPVENLLAKKDDLNASAAERASALADLRMMGYVGELASYADVQRVQEQLEAADTEIEFAGKTYSSLEDMLDDDNIAGIVDGVLKGNLEAYDEDDNPQGVPQALFDIIMENQRFFKDMVTTLKTEVGEYTTVQATYERPAEVPDEQHREVMTLMGRNPDSPYQTAAFNINDLGTGYETYKGLYDKSLSADNRTSLSNFITELKTSGIAEGVQKEVLKLLPKETVAQLSNLPLANQKNYIEGIRIEAKLDELRGQVRSGQTVAGKDMFAQLAGIGAADLSSAISELENLVALGDESAQGILNTYKTLWGDGDPMGILSRFEDLAGYTDLTKLSTLQDTFTAMSNNAKDMLTKQGESQGLLDHLQGEVPITDAELVRASVGKITKDKSMVGTAKKYDELGAKWGYDKIEPAFDLEIKDINEGGVHNKFVSTGLRGITNDEAGDLRADIDKATGMMAALPDGSPLEAKVLPKLKEGYAAVLTSGYSMPDFNEVTAVAKSLYPAGPIDLGSVPDEYKFAFSSEGRLKAVSGSTFYNPIVQDFVGAISNYTAVYGSTGDVTKDINDFFSFVKVGKGLGITPFSPNKDTGVIKLGAGSSWGKGKTVVNASITSFQSWVAKQEEKARTWVEKNAPIVTNTVDAISEVTGEISTKRLNVNPTLNKVGNLGPTLVKKAQIKIP